MTQSPIPQVNVKPGLERNERSHDISLSDGVETIGLKYPEGQSSVLQKIPISDPLRIWNDAQADWTTGRGKRKFRDDPQGYYHAKDAWTQTANKVFPVPKWRFPTWTSSTFKFRTQNMFMSDNVGWFNVDATNYVSVPLTAVESYSADKAMIIVRRVGTPGTLTIKLASDNTNKPGTVLQTVTKTISDITDWVTQYVEVDWSGTQALTSGTVYWLYAYGDAADNSANHWEIGVDYTSTGSKVSANSGSTWAAPSPDFQMHYRVVATDANQRLWYFMLQNALYCVTTNADRTASTMWINGDRGTTTSATSTTLSHSGKSWTTNMWANAYVRIWDGTGDGQVRKITSNTGTQLTVPTWDVTPDTTSKFVIYYTPIWQPVTFSVGTLGVITNQPKAAMKTAWLPRGSSAAMQRMYYNASDQHTLSAEVAGNAYECIEVHQDPKNGYQFFGVTNQGVVYGGAPAQDTSITMTFIKTEKVGGTDFVPTNIYSTGERLYVIKENGIWYLEEKVPKHIGLNLKDIPDRTNGLAITSLGSILYLGWGHSMGYLSGTDFKDILNYRSVSDGLPSNQRGFPSSACSILSWVLMVVDGGADNYSSVYMWNGLGWMELFRGWKAGLRIRHVYYQPNPEARGRIWLDVGGEPVYIDLPKYAANPLLDTGLAFQHEFELISGTHDVDKETLYKFLSEYHLDSENLTAGTRWVELDYQTGADIGTTTWYRATTFDQSPGQIYHLDIGEVQKVRFRLRGYTTVGSTPPVVTATNVVGKIASPKKYQFIGTFQVGGIRTYDGQDDFLADYVSTWLEKAYEKQVKLTFRACAPDDDDRVVTIAGLPAPVKDSIRNEEWKGRLSVAIQDA